MRIAILIISLLFVLGTNGQELLKGSLSEKELFLPGHLSKEGRYEFGICISKDEQELFFAVDHGDQSSIYSMKYLNNEWQDEIEIESLKGFSVNDPMLNPGEDRLYFIQNQRIDTLKKRFNIFYCEWTGGSWSEPIMENENINSQANEYYISFNEKGDIFFASNRNQEYSFNFDIFKSELINGEYAEAIPISPVINTKNYEADAFIAPDESYIIFSSSRIGGYGQGDLYISFRDDDGIWQPAINMGPEINDQNHQLCPFVSRNGKYFYFTSNQDIWRIASDFIELCVRIRICFFDFAEDPPDSNVW